LAGHTDPGTEKVVLVGRAWLLVVFGYLCALALAVDPAGWYDPAFTIVRDVPGGRYAWAVTLALVSTVYVVGELTNRGHFILLGAALSATWFALMALTISRMLYTEPHRVSILAPLTMFLVAALYISRAIVFTSGFTAARWTTNSWYSWAMVMLMLISLGQIIIRNPPVTDVLAVVQRPLTVELAAVNFLGAAVVLFGLGLKDRQLGLTFELTGGISLLITLTWYAIEAIEHAFISKGAWGFGVVAAFVTVAMLHRCIQILLWRYARWSGNTELADKVFQALTAEKIVEVPSAPQIVEVPTAEVATESHVVAGVTSFEVEDLTKRVDAVEEWIEYNAGRFDGLGIKQLPGMGSGRTNAEWESRRSKIEPD
jgi:hypothetical protein